MTPFSADAELKRQWRSSPSTTLLLIHEDAFLSFICITLLSGSGRGQFCVRTALLLPNGSVGANHKPWQRPARCVWWCVKSDDLPHKALIALYVKCLL